MTQTTAAPATGREREETEAPAERYGEAWNSHDLDAILALHAPDGVFHLHAPGVAAVEGREAIRSASLKRQLEGGS